MQDNYVEMILVEGNTPQEIAAKYAEIVNNAYRRNEMGLSARWGVMLEWSLHISWLEEIRGSYFAVLEWYLARYQSREDFLGEES